MNVEEAMKVEELDGAASGLSAGLGVNDWRNKMPNDECRNCTCRGNLEKCLGTPCSQHNSWFAATVQKDPARIISILASELECSEFERIHAIIYAPNAGNKGSA